MRRAVQLARLGEMDTSPNPMVGAVIVRNGQIIGEGFHRRCGEGHAEVNAIASVKDTAMLGEATIYVTLEPCSHYGKTPPCAKLIIDKGIRHVVVGTLDPNEKVAGRGIRMLREAGVEVATGILEQECRAINPKFMTAHTLRRPYVTLKWAQSADGFIDRNREDNEKPAIFSTPETGLLVHKLRATHDAILVGRGTWLRDRPSLSTRFWPGRSPQPIILSHTSTLPPTTKMQRPPLVVSADDGLLADRLSDLFKDGYISLLVEGGRNVLQQFIDQGLWDITQVETAPFCLGCGIAAPTFTHIPSRSILIGSHRIDYYLNESQS